MWDCEDLFLRWETEDINCRWKLLSTEVLTIISLSLEEFHFVT